jgi:hypothetical protein
MIVRAATLIVLFACRAPSAPPRPVAAPASPPVTAAPMPPEAVPPEAAPPEAAPPEAAPQEPRLALVAPALPAEFAGVTPWVYRELQTGAITQRHTLAIYRLHRKGERAALLVEEREATSPDPFAERIDNFTTTSFRLYQGTVAMRGRAQTFTLADGAEKLDLPCRLATIAVASASAFREPSARSADEECGDRGKFRPPGTRRVEVLSCLPFAKDDPDPDRKEQLAFAPEPGIEFLYVNDDCSMQGGGYRAIAPGGAIASIRKPRPIVSPGASGEALEALKRTLARSITTCFATGKLLAQQGSASAKVRQWRERVVVKRCTEDRWPLRVRECVAEADHDPLSCTAHFETQRQRTRWNAVFEQWSQTAGT